MNKFELAIANEKSAAAAAREKAKVELQNTRRRVFVMAWRYRKQAAAKFDCPVSGIDFSECLKRAWDIAKAENDLMNDGSKFLKDLKKICKKALMHKAAEVDKVIKLGLASGPIWKVMLEQDLDDMIQETACRSYESYAATGDPQIWKNALRASDKVYTYYKRHPNALQVKERDEVTGDILDAMLIASHAQKLNMHGDPYKEACNSEMWDAIENPEDRKIAIAIASGVSLKELSENTEYSYQNLRTAKKRIAQNLIDKGIVTPIENEPKKKKK